VATCSKRSFFRRKSIFQQKIFHLKLFKGFFTHPTVTSNILLPTELDTAISPNPLRATITDVIKSGMDVPAARNVRPITCTRVKKRLKKEENELIDAYHHDGCF
jgi:hypothetical protein